VAPGDAGGQARRGPGKYAIFLPTNEWPPQAILGLQAGSPLITPAGYGAFRQPAFAGAFDFLLSLYRDGLAPPMSNTGIANLYQEFARGTFSMYITGPWNLGEFRDGFLPSSRAPGGTAPLPGPTGPGSGVSARGRKRASRSSAPRATGGLRFSWSSSSPAPSSRPGSIT